MTFTWTFEIIDLVPFNLNSRQRDIIKQVGYVIRGTDSRGHYSEAGGAAMFDDNTVIADSYTSIEDISNEDLKNWVTSKIGSERIQEMKDEITATVNSLPDDWVVAPIEE